MQYTESHEWLRVDGSCGTVGITQYAQKELGEIVSVDLPKVGTKVEFGEEVCVLESTKAAADVYAPASGTIVAINEKLLSCPESLNHSPETEGWLFQIELFDTQSGSRLLSFAEYQTMISGV